MQQQAFAPHLYSTHMLHATNLYHLHRTFTLASKNLNSQQMECGLSDEVFVFLGKPIADGFSCAMKLLFFLGVSILV